MVTWNIGAANAGTSEEYIEINAIGTCAMGFMVILRAPMFYDESSDADKWRARLSLRIEAGQLPCKCGLEGKCPWHQILEKEWAEEDKDAIDSWLESRGDSEAMFRRMTRKFKLQAEFDPDDL